MSTHSVPDGVLNGGVGTIGGIDASTEPGGSVRFNLFFDILLISFQHGRSQFTEFLHFSTIQFELNSLEAPNYRFQPKEKRYPNDDCCCWNTAVLSTNYFFLLSVPFLRIYQCRKVYLVFCLRLQIARMDESSFSVFFYSVCRCVCACVCVCTFVCGFWHLLVSIGNSRGTARKFIVKIRSHVTNNGTVNNVYKTFPISNKNWMTISTKIVRKNIHFWNFCGKFPFFQIIIAVWWCKMPMFW